MLLCPRLLNLTRTNPDAARIDAIQAPPSSMIPAPPMLPSFGFSSGAQCRSLARIVNRGAPSPSFFLVASRETRRSAGAGLLERGMQLVSSALLASPASATCLPASSLRAARRPSPRSSRRHTPSASSARGSGGDHLRLESYGGLAFLRFLHLRFPRLPPPRFDLLCMLCCFPYLVLSMMSTSE